MPKLTMVVPVFNEEPRLAEVLDKLMASPCPIEREWIFIDDKSSDQSLKILKDYQKKYGFVLLEQDVNRGKGAAVIRGFNHATGDLVMVQDADFEYDPADIPMLLQPLLQGKADVVYGSRFKQGNAYVHRTFHFFVNKFLTFVSNLLSGIYLTDMETCYKVFRTDIVKGMNLVSESFGIEIELTANIAKLRFHIFEMPISYYPRTKLQGKKINWKDGVAALWHLFRFNILRSKSKTFKADFLRKYQSE